MRAIYFSVEAIVNGFFNYNNTLKSLANLCVKVTQICLKR